MDSQQGGGDYVGKKRLGPFSYDSMATTFDSVPPKIYREILHLESVEVGDQPYGSDSEFSSEKVKWIPNLGRFRKMRLNFLSSLVLNQHTTMFLCLSFKDI